jgi:N-acetylmuramoyl-L-alanine amidase
MKRHIKYIIVHSTATFDPKVSQFYGAFHYVVERNGEIKRVQHDSTIIKNVEAVDNDALHLGDTRTPVQEESLFNKLVALSVKYPSARIMGHDEFEASANCPGFHVKEWLKNYEPEIALA